MSSVIEKNLKERIANVIKMHVEYLCETPNGKLYCNLCNKYVNAQELFNINSHLSSKNHLIALKNFENKKIVFQHKVF